jgi:uncharacterized protein YqeY
MVTTKEKLENALKDAMRSKDDLHKRTLRMALSAIRLAEIDQGAALDEPAVLAILQKARTAGRLRRRSGNRPTWREQAEITVLENFCRQLGRERRRDTAGDRRDWGDSRREMGQVESADPPLVKGWR